MKVTGYKITAKKHSVNVDFPFYCKVTDVGEFSDTTTYMKITKDSIFRIEKREHVWDAVEYSTKVQTFSPSEANDRITWFTEPEHQSSKEEFETVLNELKQYLLKF